MTNIINREMASKLLNLGSLIQSQQLFIVNTDQKRLVSHRHPSHDHKSPNFYYHVLEITPKANQSQIKDAYYKLSKKYHPDVNPTAEANLKFQQISEAYEVLGKISTRRMYDRGVHRTGHTSHARTTGHTERNTKYYSDHSQFHSHEGFAKRARGPISGRSKIYDFDEWYRAHYTENRVKHQENKKIIKEMQEHEEMKRKSKEDASIFPFIILTVVVACVMYQNFEDAF